MKKRKWDIGDDGDIGMEKPRRSLIIILRDLKPATAVGRSDVVDGWPVSFAGEGDTHRARVGGNRGLTVATASKTSRRSDESRRCPSRLQKKKETKTCHTDSRRERNACCFLSWKTSRIIKYRETTESDFCSRYCP